MNPLKNMKLGDKLTAAFSVLILFMLLVWLNGFIALRKTHRSLADIFAVRLPSVDLILEIDRDLHQLLVAERSMIFTDVGSPNFQQLVSDYEENLEQSETRWLEYTALPATREESTQRTEYEAARKEWIKVSRQIVEGRKSDTIEGRRLAIDLSRSEAPQKFQAMRDCLDRLTNINLAIAKESNDQAKASYRSSMILSLTSILVATVIGILLMLMISRGITGSVIQVKDMMQKIAQGEGDLTQRIPVGSRDEIGMLAEGFNAFAGKLHDIIGQVKNNTIKVAVAAEEISTTANELATGADEQNAQAGEVSVGIQEMSTSILQNSQHAGKTAQISEKAALQAQEGVKAMQAARIGMEQIVASTTRTAEAIGVLAGRAEQIGEIVAVIDGIADQTNLLALNAAVEAARAGEQGRGFAVVADEVRKLAERTAASTKEISNTIKAIQKETQDAALSMKDASGVVTDGRSAVERTEAVLSGIVDSVNMAMDMMQQIAAASEEQSSGAEEVSASMESITAVTKQTASGAEKLAASAEELNAQTGMLRDTVSRFRLQE
ncbi:MAG: methyl-accepting chemotaxis protein [bacterium]|nr:methyl-accepting chemotaxis protein [bacterium]